MRPVPPPRRLPLCWQHRPQLRSRRQPQRSWRQRSPDIAARIVERRRNLALGKTLAEVAIVRDAGSITAAAAFDSGIDFIKMLSLGGGMPTRISLPEKRLPELLSRLNGEPA